MNVLFLTLSSFNSIYERGIYSDLMRKIVREGHSVHVVTPLERMLKQTTNLLQEEDCQILRVRTLNIQKANIIEKGIGTILIEYQFKVAIKKFWKAVTFELIIYSTPPITFTNIVSYIKRRDKAQTYLLLKDIFPQNAVDLALMKYGGLFHQYFRRKEAYLYSISDRIGCMSPANVDYLRQHNPRLDPCRIHVNPNSIELVDNNKRISRAKIRSHYKIPENATVYIYGGNLGKPQGIGFLMEVIAFYSVMKDVFFVVVGSGTEYSKIFSWFREKRPINALLLPQLSKSKFDELLAVSDVGLILLDPRFTIPNFPSRLLSYLEFSLPIIAATDKHTDIGKIAQDNDFGYWCENGNIISMCNYINNLKNNQELRKKMGDNGKRFLSLNYSVEVSYSKIFN